MEGILGIGFIAGVVLTLIVVCIVLASNRKDDNEGVLEGKSDDGDILGSCGSIVFKPNRDVDLDNWPFDKGSEEEKEELEKLAHGLYVMREVTGLCRTEKEMLTKAVLYIKRGLDD